MLSKTYFDKSDAENFQQMQRANSSMKSTKKFPRIQPEMISTSGAKNLRLLRESGKV
jgi:hypothetical protein